MSYGNIIISEQPLFRTISERRQSRKAFVENPVEIRNSARYCKAILKKEESILHATIRKDGKAAFRKG